MSIIVPSATLCLVLRAFLTRNATFFPLHALQPRSSFQFNHVSFHVNHSSFTMDTVLRCNDLGCRAQLRERAVVTTCR